MPKTRHLSDLYQVGKKVTIDDGQGAVSVWLQKLSPLDQETAVRKANAKRAMVLSLSRDSDASEEDRAAFTNEVFNVAETRESIINFLAADDVSRRLQAIEAEIANEDEWSDDNYLQGLWDAAEAGFDDDEDKERVEAELNRFQEQFDKRVARERDAAAKDFDVMSDEKLIRKATDLMIEAKASTEWLTEYRKCEVWLGTRHLKDHKKRYFTSREEVDYLPIEVIGVLIEEYQNLNVDVVEGKDSEEALDS